MKKVISAGLLMLVASMVFSGIPIPAEAQTDLNILLKIALQAQREVKNQISSDSSEEIKRLFEEASNQIVLLEKSLERDDPSSAKQHFLNAMKMFKRITQMISSDSPTQELQSTDAASSSQRDQINNLERIKKFITTLKSIAKNQSVSFDEADRLVSLAEKQIKENDSGLDATLDDLKLVLGNIQKDLRKMASQTTDDRTIKFFNDMLNRLEKRGADQESLSDARDMLSDYEQQIIDGNYDEAKKLKNELTQLIRELYNATS
jgi:ribosomal protein L7/L12